MGFRVFLHKVINWMQQSILLPNIIRVHFLRAAGYQVDSSARIASGVFIGSKNLNIGREVFINVNCFLDGAANITIHEGVHLGSFVKLITGTHIYSASVFRRKGTSVDRFLPVILKRGSWIGTGAIILPGVVIEEGCVIGAGALVTKSTEPNGLYVGSPAKRIKNLPIESS